MKDYLLFKQVRAHLNKRVETQKIFPLKLILFVFLFFSLQFSIAQLTPPNPEISGGAEFYFLEQQELKNDPNWTPWSQNFAPGNGSTIDVSSLIGGPSPTWDGIAFGSGSNSAPPDPIGAAGQNHVVNVVNRNIEWYTKAGVQQNSQTLQSFFNSPTGTFDPKVIYDQYEDRFVVVTLEFQGRNTGTAGDDVSNIYIAVSDDGDPNGTWYKTSINSLTVIGGVNHWADYPGFAIDEEAVYITNNMFGFEGVTNYGVRLWVIDKGTAGGFYAGGATSWNIYDPYAGGGNASTTQPAHTFGTPPAGVGTYLLSQDGTTVGGNERMQWIRVDNPLGAISFTRGHTSLGNVATSFNFPDAPQLGGPKVVQTNDRRALHAVWRNGLIATCFTAEGLGADVGQATAIWALLNDNGGGAPTLNDVGSIGGEDIAPGAFTFFPSVALNSNGDLGIGFSASAPSIFPGAYYTAHEAVDPPGVVQPTQTLRAGVMYYDIFSTRWGDYTGTAVDPVDDCFWVYNEYAGMNVNGNSVWSTAWGKFCVQSCAISNVALQGPPICDPATPGVNALFTVSFDVSSGSGNYIVTTPGIALPIGQISGAPGTANGLSIGCTYPGPTTGQTITVNVEDANDPGCLGIPIAVTLPVCPPVPPNDLCINAEALPCPADITVDITTATGSDNPGTCITFGGNEPGVWYTVTGTGGNINISTCNPGTDFDTKLTVWEGTCANLSCVTGNDDQSGGFDPACDVTGIGFNRGSTVDFCSNLGTTYYVYLYGFAGAVGNAQLVVTCDPPLMVTCPSTDLGTVPCGTPIPPAATTIAEFQALGGTVTGGCAPRTINHVDDLVGDVCTGQMLTRTYTIADANNSFNCVQTLTVLPPNNPVVVCPPDITVACEDEIMLDPNNATVTTDCGLGFTVYIKNPDAMGAPGCDGTVYTYTYVAVDDCGNQGTCTQTVTIENTPATISVPTGGVVECFEDIDISVNDATVENVCADYELYLAPPSINGELGCPGTTYTYTFRVVDVCGNIIEEDVVFTNGANDGPTIEAPIDITCECFAGVNPNPDLATVTTACGNGVDFTVDVSGPQIIGAMDCPGTRYIYTYTVTDACGRTASDQQIFTINNGPPVFQNCPDDNWLILNCEDYGGEDETIEVIEAWIASVKATNSCGMPLTVFNNFNSNNIGTCINDGYTTVTFRATDNCGRTTFCTGTVVVIDTEPPMIVEEAQDHYEVCNYLTPQNFDDWVDANGNALAYDGCSNEQIFWSTIPNNPTINCMGQMGTTEVTVTFVVRDNCGNKTETTATFHALMGTNDLVQDEGELELHNDAGTLTLFQNRPNPFKEETMITFNLPESSTATLNVFDFSGKLVHSVVGDFSAGYNEINIDRSELSGSGIFYYQLLTETDMQSRKMIVLD